MGNSIVTSFTGEVDVKPRLIRMVTSDTLDVITAPGYLQNNPSTLGVDFLSTDFVFVSYASGFSGISQTLLTVSISPDNVITLLPQSNAINPPLILKGEGRILIPGTVSVTQGDVHVIGASTLFTTLLVGQSIIINEKPYLIASISDNLHLTLNVPYAGPSGSGFSANVDDAFIQCYTSNGNLVFSVLANGSVVFSNTVTITPPFELVGTGLIPVTGTGAISNGGTILTGTGTSFTSVFRIGQSILIQGVPYTVASIATDTDLRISTTYQGSTGSSLSLYTDSDFLTCNTSSGNPVFEILPDGSVNMNGQLSIGNGISQLGGQFEGGAFPTQIITTGTSTTIAYTDANKLFAVQPAVYTFNLPSSTGLQVGFHFWIMTQITNPSFGVVNVQVVPNGSDAIIAPLLIGSAALIQGTTSMAMVVYQGLSGSIPTWQVWSPETPVRQPITLNEIATLNLSPFSNGLFYVINNTGSSTPCSINLPALSTVQAGWSAKFCQGQPTVFPGTGRLQFIPNGSDTMISYSGRTSTGVIGEVVTLIRLDSNAWVLYGPLNT